MKHRGDQWLYLVCLQVLWAVVPNTGGCLALKVSSPVIWVCIYKKKFSSVDLCGQYISSLWEFKDFDIVALTAGTTVRKWVIIIMDLKKIQWNLPLLVGLVLQHNWLNQNHQGWKKTSKIIWCNVDLLPILPHLTRSLRLHLLLTSLVLKRSFHSSYLSGIKKDISIGLHFSCLFQDVDRIIVSRWLNLKSEL